MRIYQLLLVACLGLASVSLFAEGEKKQPQAKAMFEKTVLYFDFDDSSLGVESRSKLDSLSEYLKQHSALSIFVWGYADSIGTESYNLKLSESRAEQCAQYLEGKGIAKGRINTIGKGESDEPQHKNARRVELQPLIMKE